MTKEELEAIYYGPGRLDAIAKSVGRGRKYLVALADSYGLPRRRPRSDVEYIPSREEIDAATAEIRSGWSEKERALRSIHTAHQISPTTILEARIGLRRMAIDDGYKP